jgi:hypothetical protein
MNWHSNKICAFWTCSFSPISSDTASLRLAALSSYKCLFDEMTWSLAWGISVESIHQPRCPHGTCSMEDLCHGSLSGGHIQPMDLRACCRGFRTLICQKANEAQSHDSCTQNTGSGTGFWNCDGGTVCCQLWTVWEALGYWRNDTILKVHLKYLRCIVDIKPTEEIKWDVRNLYVELMHFRIHNSKL